MSLAAPGLPIALTGQDPRLVRNMRIRRGLEGPQLIVEWDAPSDPPKAGEIRVLRKLFEFATNPLDPAADVVFEGPATEGGFVTDLDVGACRCYYYTAFTHNFFPKDEWLHASTTQVSEIAIPTGFFGTEAGMFNLLPELYMLEDKILGETPDAKEQSFFALYPAFDPGSREWFNIGENTDPSREPVKKGPLQRFLKTVAVDLDLAKGLVDCMPTLWDVDETCCENLPALGEMIGLQVNRELPCSAQRQEIKEHVAILKVKGTATALRARARSVSGLTTFVQEWGANNILYTNQDTRTTIASPNADLAAKFMLPGDDTDYTPGGVVLPNSFCVFFLLECDDCLSEQIVRKLNRVLVTEFPACHEGHLVFRDCLFVDETELDPSDAPTTIIEDRVVEENAFSTCWLFTNTLPDDPADASPPGTGKPGVRQLTNSLRALTANPGIICAELFTDTVICKSLVDVARVDCSNVG